VHCNNTEVTTMAESSDDAVKSAEEAYAAHAAAAAPARNLAAEVAEAKPAEKKPAAANSRTISKPRRAKARKARQAAAQTPVPTLTELKEKIMANAKTADFSKPFTDAVSEFQSKAKAAYDKGAELAATATEFAKGNAEAAVESGKIYAAGVQELSKSYVEEAKSAYETFTADLKELAAVKSPAELFQLQAKLARRNFDALVAYGSKNADAVTKLASESFAPISSRISLAAETIAKAA
jgi:phasin family protein